jgi:hypothetical protein
MNALDHVYTEDARILPPGAEMIDNLAASHYRAQCYRRFARDRLGGAGGRNRSRDWSR